MNTKFNKFMPQKFNKFVVYLTHSNINKNLRRPFSPLAAYLPSYLPRHGGRPSNNKIHVVKSAFFDTHTVVGLVADTG